MLCSRPYRMSKWQEFGCGQCMPCRFNRRRVWTGRLIQESHLHEASVFATLTYDQEHYPEDGSVSVREGQLFLKRLREVVSPEPLRFFLVGEYGGSTWRAHYHAILFGLRDPMAVNAAWRKGFVHCVPFSYELAQYICGYAVKGMTADDDPRLGGRRPEFARMSLRPGIGAGATDALVNALVDQETGEIRMGEDVPTVMRAGGRVWPLGRYIRRRVRARLGMEVGESQASGRKRWLEELERWPDLDGEAKEQRRLQDERTAAVRNSIAKTRRGL